MDAGRRAPAPADARPPPSVAAFTTPRNRSPALEARAVNCPPRMALPFDLPALSRGFADLTPAARDRGAEIARAAAAALEVLAGGPVSIEARPVPGVPAPRALAARVALDLVALPAPAVLEVEPQLVVRLVSRLAGGDGAPDPAAALTPVEATALELLALTALDGACAVTAVDAVLAPRLARGVREPSGALAVELTVDAAGLRGRARLLVPPAAVRALAGEPDLPRASVVLPASVRRGAAILRRDELEALAPGDVVLVDAADGPAALVLPGGARALGQLDGDDRFHVEETTMAVRISELPVRLEVELARVELTLGALAALAPGAALPLALDRRGEVVLRAGERAIARGELVDIDGAIGVRILSVEGTP
jgi:type III secretion protein Q